MKTLLLFLIAITSMLILTGCIEPTPIIPQVSSGQTMILSGSIQTGGALYDGTGEDIERETSLPHIDMSGSEFIDTSLNDMDAVLGK